MKGVQILNVKTQVRRLKYFSLILNHIADEGLPKDYLSVSVTKWSDNHHADFENYGAVSGEITRSINSISSRSFLNYYDVLSQLELVVEQGNIVLATRTGQVLPILDDVLNDSTSTGSAYGLELLEKCFFTAILIKIDFDGFLSVIELLKEYPSLKLDDYLSSFKEFYSRRLRLKLTRSSIHNHDLVTVAQRVDAWKSPKRYSENIVSPRINWLYDLDLIDENKWREKKIALNQNGYSFLINFFSSPLGSNNATFNLRSFDRCVISIIANTYFPSNLLKKWSLCTSEERAIMASESLNLAISNFSIKGIPRIPAWSTSLLSSLFILFKFKTLIDLSEFLEWIGQDRKINKTTYAYRSAEREGESYITFQHG